KGWTTHNNTHGHTEWLPPPHLDHGQPWTNTFHHPERFLHNQDDDDKPD
ncbi:HNH endonuclease, partial [Mycobacterium tuberculosis]